MPFMVKCGLPMSKLLLIVLLITAFNTSLFAQRNTAHTSSSYEYFIRISGIQSKHDIEFLEGIISKKQGITFFMANRYPARYFLLKSDHSITKAQFEQFLLNSPFSIEFYGEGEKGKENAILIYNKTKAPQ